MHDGSMATLEAVVEQYRKPPKGRSCVRFRSAMWKRGSWLSFCGR